ncbi:hypothetical protein [Leekyejoonella antrihumi]|uniref:GPI inositol-deacylase PGAP1-like alpha/beta domain-containing protein n=1 Tax=Leekyejoonella antrihumi TaxID=1660198 RepID=A0A563E6U5_9MICO|nr:hypothetical protein [Leekyejoonella antrihumi]TWP37983.1 hypothetical protein FGL98_04550 [Leekyejoonella antrihumi]
MGGGCTSSGGPLSTDANLIDMRYTAGALDGSGDEATMLCGEVLRIAAHLPVKSALLSPGSAAQVAEHVAGLSIGPASFGALAVRMEVVSRGMRAGATAYETADLVNRNALAAIAIIAAPTRLTIRTLNVATLATVQTAGSSPGLFTNPATYGSGLLLAARRWGSFFVSDLGAAATRDPSIVDDGLAVFREMFWMIRPGDPRFESQVGQLLAIGRHAGVFTDGTPLTVTPVADHPVPHTPVDGPRDLGDLAAQEAMVESGALGGDAQARVRVHHVTHSDGSAAWIVNIPGTQNWQVNGPHNPTDATANVASMAGAPLALYPAITTAMRMAMKQAGVPPGSQPVMLVGHSQAGIVATRMVQNPRFQKEFNVTQVVTMAAPVTRMKVPDGVHALEIEHVGDLVPSLDEARLPTQANAGQLTCDTDLPTDNPLDLHSADLYAETAREHLGRDSPDPLARRFYDRSEPFLGGTDTVYDYYVRRP